MTTNFAIGIADAAEALSQCLEAMAFMSLAPSEQPFERPTDPVHVRIEFRGTVTGALELLAPRTLGRLVVENIGATSPDQPCTDAQAEDVFRELANVTCGRMLRDIAGKYELELPMTSLTLTDTQWQDCTTLSDHTVVLDCEGMPICMRLTVQH